MRPLFAGGVTFQVVHSLRGTGSSGGGVWEGRRGRRRGGRIQPALHAEYPVVVCDEKLDEHGLVAGLQDGDHRHVGGNHGAQQRRPEHDPEVARGHLVIVVLRNSAGEERRRAQTQSDLETQKGSERSRKYNEGDRAPSSALTFAGEKRCAAKCCGYTVEASAVASAESE